MHILYMSLCFSRKCIYYICNYAPTYKPSNLPSQAIEPSNSYRSGRAGRSRDFQWEGTREEIYIQRRQVGPFTLGLELTAHQGWRHCHRYFYGNPFTPWISAAAIEPAYSSWNRNKKDLCQRKEDMEGWIYEFQLYPPLSSWTRTKKDQGKRRRPTPIDQ